MIQNQENLFGRQNIQRANALQQQVDPIVDQQIEEDAPPPEENVSSEDARNEYQEEEGGVLLEEGQSGVEEASSQDVQREELIIQNERDLITEKQRRVLNSLKDTLGVSHKATDNFFTKLQVKLLANRKISENLPVQKEAVRIYQKNLRMVKALINSHENQKFLVDGVRQPMERR